MAESIIVVRLSREPIRLTAGDTLDLSDIVPDLSLDEAALFASLRLSANRAAKG